MPVSNTPTDYSVHVKDLGLQSGDTAQQGAFFGNGMDAYHGTSGDVDAAMQPVMLNGGDTAKLRKANKMVPPAPGATEDLSRLEAHRNVLKSIFALELEPGVVPDFTQTFPPDLDPDTPIDDSQHTALHWAAALARTSIVAGLVAFGADVHRGNAHGETPLIRAVLVTNNADVDSFGALLSALGPSVRTMDDAGRTVLHHIAQVSGLPGREQTTRYYLENIFEHVLSQDKAGLRDLVDALDENGETALIVAARAGSRSVAKLLLDVGADTTKANFLGLTAGDFGLDGLVSLSTTQLSTH